MGQILAPTYPAGRWGFYRSHIWKAKLVCGARPRTRQPTYPSGRWGTYCRARVQTELSCGAARCGPRGALSTAPVCPRARAALDVYGARAILAASVRDAAHARDVVLSCSLQASLRLERTLPTWRKALAKLAVVCRLAARAKRRPSTEWPQTDRWRCSNSLRAAWLSVRSARTAAAAAVAGACGHTPSAQMARRGRESGCNYF